MLSMPEGSREGILKGMYRLRQSEKKDAKLRTQLLGSGAILWEVLKAQQMLEEKYGVAADVWSVPGWKELYRDAISAERWNMLHPTEKPRVPYIAQCLQDTAGPIVAATDYVKGVPLSVARWCPRPMIALGTDGFGRSETRAALRNFFEVDSRFITVAALNALAREGKIKPEIVQQAIKELKIDAEKPDPLIS
jgi:pyruvate dehydrogenase E1 component